MAILEDARQSDYGAAARNPSLMTAPTASSSDTTPLLPGSRKVVGMYAQAGGYTDLACDDGSLWRWRKV